MDWLGQLIRDALADLFRQVKMPERHLPSAIEKSNEEDVSCTEKN